ncbi:MAG: hypothetical protein ABI867_11555 [Kofleriaceae bacterium]
MRWLIAMMLVCGFARPARADLAGSIYGDVQNVIEELIQGEVTQSVVRTVGYSSPALAFYMHGTLERLSSPYWGSLGRVMKDDLTVIVADFVYWHMSTGGGDGDIIASAKRFFNCAKPGEAWNPQHCKRLIDAIQGQKRPLLEVECRRTKPAQERKIACHVGLAVLAALKGRGEVRQHLVDALSEIVLLEISDKNVGGRMRDILTKWMDLPKDLPTPLIEALANPDLGAQLSDDALDKRCADPEMIKQAIDDPTGPFSWLCFAVTNKKMEPILAATVTVKEGKHVFTHVIQHWELEAAIRELDGSKTDDDIVYRLFAEEAWDKECPLGVTPVSVGPGDARPETPCAGKRFQPGAEITVAWLRRQALKVTIGANGKVTGGQHGFLLGPLFKFRKLSQRINELRALVPPSLKQTLFYAGQTVSVDTRPALRSLHRMARFVSELRARWYLWAQNPGSKSFDELDVVELLNVARSSWDKPGEGRARSSAEGGAESIDQATIEANSALAFLDKEASGGAATLDIGDWLRMVMRADYRSLAIESLRAALDLQLSSTSRPHETFFLSLASYLLDNGEGINEAVARSAFRASAKQLLLSSQKRGVPRVGDRVRFGLLPLLSVRLAFNDAYSVSDEDNRRKGVAADWPTLLFAVNDYVGFELSAIDFVAPLAEMALRPPGTYRNQANVALDALRPRLGVWIAVPQFSRRLALTAGFGARFVGLDAVDTDANPDTKEFEYSRKASLAVDAGLQFVF